jgi:hypothetical protein
LDPRKDFPYLTIRNERTRSGNQLNAELGDIIVTRDGGFVGVVTGFDEKNPLEAKVMLFEDQEFFRKAVRIPVTKSSNGRYADEFGRAVRSFRGPLERR